MSNKNVIDLLGKLNRALEGLDAADETSKKKLAGLIRKIEQKAGLPGKSEKDSPLAEEIKEAALEFEAKHPVIAETLEQVKRALYSIGL